MSPATDPRESRLPKYAQTELESLRRRIRDLEKHVCDLTGDIAETDTWVDSMAGARSADWPLPPGSRVAYRLTDRNRFGAHVRTWLQRDQWDGVKLHIQGDTSLLIHPSASNTFFVTMRE